jgi:hypothetical protein
MARYNFTVSIFNNSGKLMSNPYFCKGTKENPSGEGTEHDHLYHGQVTLEPTPTIPSGGTGNFAAKSSGNTIQGTLVYTLEGQTDPVWVYFHVPDFGSRHNQSGNVHVNIVDDSDHAVVTYVIE